MRTIGRATVILLAGIAFAAALIPLGDTSWADRMRTQRGARRPPPSANTRLPERRSAPQRTPGVFSHFRGPQSIAGDALRLTQVAVIQIGIPAGATVVVLALIARARDRRKRPPLVS